MICCGDDAVSLLIFVGNGRVLTKRVMMVLKARPPYSFVVGVESQRIYRELREMLFALPAHSVISSHFHDDIKIYLLCDTKSEGYYE
jgi:hypothetical protein